MNIALIQHRYDVPLDDPCCYPMGFMYISAALKRAGHDVTVYNLNLWNEYPDDYTVFDAVLMTGYEEFLPRIKAVGHECRKNGVKTILGGALATYKPEEMLNHVDTIVVGEGENVICQALNSTGIVQGTKPNLDNLPLPDYEGFGIAEYHRRHDYRYMGVLTSRGCAYNCKFCAQTCAMQNRSLPLVFEEIDLYKAKYGVACIVFNDNTLNLSKERFLAICEGMEKRGIAWSAAIRCDNFDQEMVIAAKKSGAVYFVVGVESFSQKRLDMMNKRLRVEDIYNTLDLLHKYNIDYHGNVLFGLPGDTAEDIFDELNRVPKRYKIFPCFIQKFVGTELGDGDCLTEQQRQDFKKVFLWYIQSQGKYLYPELRPV